MDLQKFKKDLGKIQWNLVRRALAAGSGGARGSAIYFVENHTILLSAIYWRQTPPEIQPLVATHEAFGAMGYHDEEYNLTLGLWAAHQNFEVAKSLRDKGMPDFQNITTTTKTPVYKESNGTGTGVGGGGDYFEIDMKVQFLKQVMQQKPSKNQLILLNKIRTAKFIVAYLDDPGVTFQPGQIDISKKGDILQVHFSVVICFYPDKQEQIITNALEKIGQLYGL